MYSAYKLNKQGDSIQSWSTPFPIWNQSVVPCPVLTVASWPAYRILRRQVRWSNTPISLRICHSLLWSTGQKLCSQWRSRCFSGFSCLLCVSNLISGSSAFSKSSLYIWKLLVHLLFKISLKDFEYYLASMWNEHNCVIVWTFFGIALLWNWSENWPFPVLWPLLNFPNLLAYWLQHFNSIIFCDLK